MSSAPIVVRYDVQNAEKVVSDTGRVVKTLDALRTTSGQTATSVKQMESGFRADAIGGFSTAVTNADSKVTGFRTKLAGIGSQFSQNATSFGVATASIWGVYNAYDGLEKVQIRASASAARVSTLETSLATLTQRRAEAVAKGNLSGQDLALLNDRIANTTEKLSVAQARNADLQGDVNEAWGAFASQVGPQAVAAGGSVVQLFTNLKGSMGGAIPAIKNFFGSLTGGGQAMAQTRGQTLLLGQGIGNLPGPMGAATVATRGLSVAMKGLLIGTGVGIAITAIGLIAQHFSQTAEAAETGTEDIEGSMGEMDDAFSGSEGSVKQWGGTVHKMVDGTVVVVKDAASQVKESLSSLAQELRTEFPGLTPEFIAGKNVENQEELERLRARKTGLQSGAIKPEAPFRSSGQEIADIDAKLRTLNKDIEENKNLMNLMFGTMSKGSGDVDKLGTSLEDVGTKTRELTDQGADLTQLFNIWQGGGFEKTGSERIAFLYDLHKKGLLNYKAGVESAIPPTKEMIEADEKMHQSLLQTAKATTEAAREEEEKKRIEEESVAVMANVVEQTFGVAEATQMAGESNADYKVRMEQLSEAAAGQIDKEQQLILAYTKTAVALNINKTRQAELSEAIHTSADAVAALILSDSTLTDVLSDGNRISELRTAGLVEGRTAAVAWYDQMIKQIAIDQQFAADQRIIAEQFASALPAGIRLTREEMQALITTEHDMGKQAIALSEVHERAFGASRSALQELIDAATQGGKDWKDAWKDLDKTYLAGKARDDFKEFITDQGEMGETLDEVIPLLEGFRMIWDTLNEGERNAQTEKFADALEKLRDQLDDISEVDIDAEIFDPLLKLKEGGLTKAELMIWEEFLNLYNRLADEGGGISDEDVQQLQDFVDNHPGMKSLGDETKTTADNMDTMSEAEKKVVENFLVAATIGLVTDQLNLQGRAVRGLTKDFGNLVDIMNQYGGGGGDGNGGFQRIYSKDYPRPGVMPEGVETHESRSDEDTGEVQFSADLTQWNTAVQQVKNDVAAIDALKPIVDFLGDHRAFVKAGNEVLKAVKQVDALRPIVDFLGDHRQYMKAASDVIRQTAAIDKLRPIVDFLGDHRHFMSAASDVESRVDEIDGMEAVVTIRAKRVGNFSAQHGMHATLQEDAWIYAHKNEKVDISPPSEHHSAFMPQSNAPSASLNIVHLEIPVSLFPGGDIIKKFVKEIPLEDVGMFPSA